MRYILITLMGLLSSSFVFAQYDEYIERFSPIAVREMNVYKIPASITLAQGILESGVGKSKLAVKSNNHFGIKCHNEWTGERTYHDDDEKQECFRKYKDPEESFVDHSQFLLNRGRYSFLFELDRTDYKGWAKGLREAGYATDRNYSKRLIKLIEDNDLHRFDLLFPEKEAKATPLKNKSGVKFIYAGKHDSYRAIGKRYLRPFGLIFKYNDVDKKSPQPAEGEIVYIRAKKKKISTDYSPLHYVEKGESMHSISQKYGIKIHALYDLNNLSYRKVPFVGQKLRLR